jgi:hypothetical protein
MNPGMPADDVIDLLAVIEMHRQEMAKESGLAAACDEALRKLHELLEREREALQSHGPGARHSANIATVMSEIAKVKNLGGDASRRAGAGNPRSARRQVSLQSAARNFPRNKGRRRTLGRGER